MIRDKTALRAKIDGGGCAGEGLLKEDEDEGEGEDTELVADCVGFSSLMTGCWGPQRL